MSRWRRAVFWKLGAGAGILAWLLGFESGRGWQFVADQGQVIEVGAQLEATAALHCVLGRK